jgi:hypothetical protein
MSQHAPPLGASSGGNEPVNFPARASLAVGERMPWRPLVASATSLGIPVGIGVIHPLLGEVIFSIEIAVALTVITVALFGSRILSERAFRLLRWFGNRPEPPAPASGS